MVSLHHIGEPFVARLLESALKKQADIPCLIRPLVRQGTWKEANLFQTLKAGSKKLKVVYDTRVHHESEKMNHLHRLDCGILSRTGRSCFAIEVKLGLPWQTGFYRKFISKRPILKELSTDLWGGSMCALLERFPKSANFDFSKLFIWTDQKKVQLAEPWGVVVRKNQVECLTVAPFRNLTHIIALEDLADRVKERFEEIAESLIWPRGKAKQTLFSTK